MIEMRWRPDGRVFVVHRLAAMATVPTGPTITVRSAVVEALLGAHARRLPRDEQDFHHGCDCTCCTRHRHDGMVR